MDTRNMQVQDQLDAMKRFDPERQIIIIWSIEDVQAVRPDLNDDQAMKVLLRAKRNHDAIEGVNWTVLEAVADAIYPEF